MVGQDVARPRLHVLQNEAVAEAAQRKGQHRVAQGRGNFNERSQRAGDNKHREAHDCQAKGAVLVEHAAREGAQACRYDRARQQHKSRHRRRKSLVRLNVDAHEHLSVDENAKDEHNGGRSNDKTPVAERRKVEQGLGEPVLAADKERKSHHAHHEGKARLRKSLRRVAGKHSQVRHAEKQPDEAHSEHRQRRHVEGAALGGVGQHAHHRVRRDGTQREQTHAQKDRAPAPKVGADAGHKRSHRGTRSKRNRHDAHGEAAALRRKEPESNDLHQWDEETGRQALREAHSHESLEVWRERSEQTNEKHQVGAEKDVPALETRSKEPAARHHDAQRQHV